MLHKIKREKNMYTGNDLFKKLHLQDMSQLIVKPARFMTSTAKSQGWILIREELIVLLVLKTR